jgi:DNA polymerase elongation subunit (family B)
VGYVSHLYTTSRRHMMWGSSRIPIDNPLTIEQKDLVEKRLERVIQIIKEFDPHVAIYRSHNADVPFLVVTDSEFVEGVYAEDAASPQIQHDRLSLATDNVHV